uniref:Uncharacterized protein n=1 Tax=Glossina austeni TaxID=7395 RepID=A0A1A9VKT8_GLOAU
MIAMTNGMQRLIDNRSEGYPETTCKMHYGLLLTHREKIFALSNSGVLVDQHAPNMLRKYEMGAHILLFVEQRRKNYLSTFDFEVDTSGRVATTSPQANWRPGAVMRVRRALSARAHSNSLVGDDVDEQALAITKNFDDDHVVFVAAWYGDDDNDDDDDDDNDYYGLDGI